MNETVVASDGALLPLAQLTQVFTYDGDFVETIEVEYLDTTYRQTFTNNGVKITEISGWVAL